MKNIPCQECKLVPATEKIFMDGDEFGKDYLYTCKQCGLIHFEMIKYPDLVIVGKDCEINGFRLYIWDVQTKYAVRLNDRTIESVKESIKKYEDGMKSGVGLYKHSF